MSKRTKDDYEADIYKIDTDGLAYALVDGGYVDTETVDEEWNRLASKAKLAIVEFTEYVDKIREEFDIEYS